MTLIERLNAKFERGHGLALALLAVVTLIISLPGFFSIPPIDRDESRFAQATKQMIETGDYINIRFQDTARNKKPVGIYWLQAAAVKASTLGAAAPIWVYRIPSLLGAIFAVLASYWALCALMRREEAFYAALLLASCVLLGVEARLAKTDAVLLAVTTLAMGAMLRVYLEDERKTIAYLFWIACGLGLLIKGPITLMVVGAAALGLCFYKKSARWLRALRPLTGAALMLLIASPWFIAIMIETQGAFLRDSIGADMATKIVSGQESHGAPPGTYSLLVWFTFFPASCFLLALVPQLWRMRRDPRCVMLWCWLLPTWIMFELVPTKLPHYVLPTYPALAGLIVLAASRLKWRLKDRWQRFASSGLAWVPFITLVVLLILSSYSALYITDQRIDFTIILTGIVVLLCGVTTFSVVSRDSRLAIAGAAIGMGILNFGVYQHILPGLEEVWLSPRIAKALAENPMCKNPQLVSANYHEPSLVFLTRTDILFTDAEKAVDFMSLPGCRAALIDEAPGKNGETPPDAAFFKEFDKSNIAYFMDQVAGRSMNGGYVRSIRIYIKK